MMYNSLVTEYFFEPKHVGVLQSGPNCRSVRQNSSDKACYFDLYLSIDKSEKIQRACFKACGSPFLIAGLEYICRALEGTMLKEHPSITYKLLVQDLSLPAKSYPIAVLIEEAYRKLITNGGNYNV